MMVPVLSIRAAVTPGRPERLPRIFDIQSRLTAASMTESFSGLIADTG